jgi:hypothetical protein
MMTAIGNVLPLDEPVGVVGEWVTRFGLEIEIMAIVNDLRSWYNELLMRAMFDAWFRWARNPWEEWS